MEESIVKLRSTGEWSANRWLDANFVKKQRENSSIITMKRNGFKETNHIYKICELGELGENVRREDIDYWTFMTTNLEGMMICPFMSTSIQIPEEDTMIIVSRMGSYDFKVIDSSEVLKYACWTYTPAVPEILIPITSRFEIMDL